MTQPPIVDVSSVLGQLSRAYSQGTFNVEVLKQAATKLGCNVSQLVEGVVAQSGGTTAEVATGRVGMATGRARQALQGIQQLRNAGALTSEVMASGGSTAAAGGAGAAGTGATGFLSVPTAAAAATTALVTLGVGLLVIGGAWIYQRATDPVGLTPVDQATIDAARTAAAEELERKQQPSGSGQWFAVQMTSGPRTIKVTVESAIAGLRSCDFLHGGLCDANTQPLGPSGVKKMREQGFATEEQAWEWVCTQVSNTRRPPLAAGWVADQGGVTVSIERPCP